MKYKIPDCEEYMDIVEKMDVKELLRTVICPDIGNDKKILHNNTGAAFFHAETSDVLKKRIDILIYQ